MNDEIAIRVHEAIERDDLEEILAIEAEHGSIARVRHPGGWPPKRKHGPLIDSFTPMMSVAYFGAHRILDCLLQRGLSVDCSSEFHDTPIGIAISRGHEETAAKMIPHSRRIDFHVWLGTALYKAVVHNKRRLARMLLEHGADPDLAPTEYEESSPRAVVRREGDDAMKRLFEHFPSVRR